MCTKKLLKVCYCTKDYSNGKLVGQRKQVFEDNACYRCTVSNIIRTYLTIDCPYQIVDTVIGDEDARLTFEVHYTEGKKHCYRQVRVIVQLLNNNHE